MRVEVRNEVMEHGERRAVRVASSSAIPKPFKNKVRTFCQNPGGFVSQENYDNDLAVVNGHSYKELKSDEHEPRHPLLAQLQSEPFNQPIEYAQKVGELTNMLGDGTYSRPAPTAISSTESAHGRKSCDRIECQHPLSPTPSRAT